MRTRSQTGVVIEPGGTLERLIERVRSRHVGASAVQRIDDWRTLQRSFTTVRPLPAQPLNPGQDIALAKGVKIESHPAPEGCRGPARQSADGPAKHRRRRPLPRLLYEDPKVVQPFEFEAARTLGGTLNVLELRGVNNPALVTEANPLVVVIPRPLGPGEFVLPVASDGEFYLPLGRAESNREQTRVLLERLPQPEPGKESTRTLGGALRIFFHKVVSRSFGTEYPYPILAVAEVEEDFHIHYEPDPATVRAKVKRAKRIGLFVHGIIGDTRDMAASFLRRTSPTAMTSY